MKLHGDNHTNIPVLIDTSLQEMIINRLQQHHTPKQISGSLARVFGRSLISHESIYQWIYHDRNDLAHYLPSKHKKWRALWKKLKKSPNILQSVGIEVRNIQENMSIFGLLEIDLLGAPSKENILTIIEKRSRYTWYYLIADQTANTVMYGILFALRHIPPKYFMSITYDNGSENVLHMNINTRLGTRSYLCNPYSAWEKGQVEYANRLLRRYFPKGTNFATITHEDVAQVQYHINNRPWECLYFRRPSDVFSDFVHITS